MGMLFNFDWKEILVFYKYGTCFVHCDIDMSKLSIQYKYWS